MQKIYESMDPANCAYIMHKGRLIFEISPNDRYQLDGQEIIFGAEEPLIAQRSEKGEYYRFQTAFVAPGSVVDRIPLPNLFKVITIYNIGYGIAKNIAKYVQITNKMYINKEKHLSGRDMSSKEYALIYAETLDRLKAVFAKIKVGWLKDVIDRYSNSLVYTKGIAFRRTSPKTDLKLQMERLREYTFDLIAGSILCEEGDQNNEMFILNRGVLEVSIGGKKVVDIGEPGIVIGEMALLLGERRTATIKTVTDSNITIIKPENLKEVTRKDRHFFLNLSASMGKRLERNCNLIRETNDLFVEDVSVDAPAPPRERTNYKELLSFVRELERYELKYRNAWITELLGNVRKMIAKARNIEAKEPG